MARRFGNTLTTASAIAVTAVLTSGLSATAATLITSAQIKDGTIQGRDVASNTLGTRVIGNSSVNSAKIANSAITGSKIANGAVGPSALSSAVKLGPIASGSVSAAGVASRQQGNYTVSHTGVGTYCVIVPGAPSTQHVLVVTPDYANDDTYISQGTTTGAEVNTNPCGGSNGYTVATYKRLTNGTTSWADEPFVFVLN